MRTVTAILCASLALLPGCGYRVSGHGDLLPDTVHTIAIPAFGNLTTRYRLTERIPAAITREFIARTRYRVVTNPEQADAILNGAIVNYGAFPNIVDQVTGRAAGVLVSVVLQVSLVERSTGKILFTRPNMEFRQRFELSPDQITYIEESETALERLSREVAQTLVSAVLETF